MPLAPDFRSLPRTALLRSRRGLWLVLMVGAVAAAVLGHTQSRDAAEPQARAPQPAALRVAPELAESRAMPPAAPLATPVGQIAIVDGLIDIDIHAIPLGEAARQLAMVTSTPNDGIAPLHDAGPRVTLKWQGRDAGAAWQQLLSFHASYIAHCVERRCSVSVFGLQAASAPPATSSGAATANQQDPPSLFPSDG